MIYILHGWLSTLHVFHLIQKFNMASTTNSFWCWSFKIFSETTRGMNMLFCRNMWYLTFLNSVVFVHRKSKMATTAGQIKKIISETRYLIVPKLNMCNRWMVPYKLSFFSENRKSKMIMRINSTTGKTFNN
jgi:hypothetical protein